MNTQPLDSSSLILESQDGEYQLQLPHLHIQDSSIFLHYIQRLEDEVAEEIAKQPKYHKRVIHRLNKMIIKVSQSSEILRLFLANLVVTRFVLPSILFYLCFRKLLGIYSLIPFNILIPAAYRILKSMHGRRGIQRTLGLRSLTPLDLLLGELVGYDMESRILTLVVQKAPESNLHRREILVIRRPAFKRAPVLPYASIADLEQILSEDEEAGVRLAFFKERHKGLIHPRTYAVLLLRSITNSKALCGSLARLIEARGAAERTILPQDRLNVSRVWDAFSTLSTHKTWLGRMSKELKRQSIPEKSLDAARKETILLLDQLRNLLDREEPVLARSRDMALYSYLYYLQHKHKDPYGARRPLSHYHDYLPKVGSSNQRLVSLNSHLRRLNRAFSARGQEDTAWLLEHLEDFKREILSEWDCARPRTLVGGIRKSTLRRLW